MKIINRLNQIFTGDAAVKRDHPRILAYCASNIGMGHYCRLLRVIGEVKKQIPEASVLLATDARDNTISARLGVAVLQLPGFRFSDHEQFKEEPELLHVNAHELKDIRAALLLALGESYRPHVLLLDTNPHGKRDEALPLLRHLRRRGGCQCILMMRDIPSPPGEPFKLSGSAASIRKHGLLYDRLLFAGDEKFFDAAKTYHWPDDVRARMRYVGFVVPAVSASSRAKAFDAYPELDPNVPTVVASFGGGWQADLYAGQMIEGVAGYREKYRRPVQMVMAIGPALPVEFHEALKIHAETLGGIVVERFSPHFPHLLAHAGLAILQAGSAPFQVLESDIPILLTHRPYKSREQEERANRLACWPGIRLVNQEEITSAECAEWIAWGLHEQRAPRSTGYCFDGIANAAQEVVQALRSVKN